MLKEYAKKIPDNVRSQRLICEADPIAKAVANSSNPAMQMLAEVWYTFIEIKAERTYCPACLKNILENFREMKPALIQLEKEYQLLKSI